MRDLDIINSFNCMVIIRDVWLSGILQLNSMISGKKLELLSNILCTWNSVDFNTWIDKKPD